MRGGFLLVLLTSLLVPLGTNALVKLKARSSGASAPPPQLGIIIPDAVSAAFSSNPGEALAILSTQAKEACSTGFAAVRFSISPLYPDFFALWVSNSTLYWLGVDRAISAMSGAGCKLMPTMFWNPFVVPDAYGAQGLRSIVLGATNVTTNTAWDASLRFIADATMHVGRMSTVVAWELVNEANLLFDVDVSVDRGANFIDEKRGTPTQRTIINDNITTDEWRIVQKKWAAIIRNNDPFGRPIGSGHSLARREAENLRKANAAGKNAWGIFDTFSQFVTNLNDTHEDLDWASVHLAPGIENSRWNLTNATAVATNVLLYVTAAASNISVGRTIGPLSLYIGAFEQAVTEELGNYVDASMSARRAWGGGAIPAHGRKGGNADAVLARGDSNARGGGRWWGGKNASTNANANANANATPTVSVPRDRQLEGVGILLAVPLSPRAFAAPRPYLNSVLDVMRSTAPAIAGADVPPFPGVRGVIKYAFVSGWMDAAYNLTMALWPGLTPFLSTSGAVIPLTAFASEMSAVSERYSRMCDGDDFLKSINYDDHANQQNQQICQRRIQGLVQQRFSPPSPYEAFVVVCKGVCRIHTAHWFRVQAAAEGTGCDCASDIEKGVFFCPTSAPSYLCRYTGLCTNESYYEASTCAPEACGRFATNEKDWNAARRSCAAGQ